MKRMSEELKDNPLLIERFPIRFDAVKAGHVEPAIRVLLEQMRNRLASLGGPNTLRTYQDILIGLDEMTDPLDFAMSIVRHLESVATTPELRAAYNAVQGPVSIFYTSIPLSQDLWTAVKAVNESGQVADLAPVHKRFLHKTVSNFRRAGADLDAVGKKKLEELDVALTKATTKFSEHVLDATNAFELLISDEAQLAGLPESARVAARASAKSKSKEGWRLTLQAPSYIAAMTYLDDRPIRQQLWEAYNTRSTAGEYDNRGLVLEILRLRKEKARLLGYRDFADLVLEDRMAHKGEQAQAFLEDLQRKTEPFFEKRTPAWRRWGTRWDTRALSPGTWLTSPRSSAWRSTISMKRSCVPTSSWTGWLPACSTSSAAFWESSCGRAGCAGVGSGGAVLPGGRCEQRRIAGRLLCGLVPAREQARRRMDGFPASPETRMRGGRILA